MIMIEGWCVACGWSILCIAHSLVFTEAGIIVCFRLADHFGGKLHMGFIKIRDRLKELEVNKQFLLEQVKISLPHKFRFLTKP